MGWAILPEVGSEYGPCADPCDHIDCDHTRKQAATKCGMCWELMGFGVKYYSNPEANEVEARQRSFEGNGDLVHAICLWKWADDERKKQVSA